MSAAQAAGGDCVSISWHGCPPDSGVFYGEGLMPRNWGDEVYNTADYLAKNWYRNGGEEFLQVDGFSFGGVPKTDLFHFFVEHLRIYQTARAIITEFGRDYRLFDDGSRYYYLIRKALRAFGAEVDEIRAGSFDKLFRGDWVKRRFHWPLAYVHYQRLYRKQESIAGFKPGNEKKPDQPILYVCQLRASEVDYFLNVGNEIDLPYYFAALRPDTLGRLCDLRLPGRGVYDWLPPKKHWRGMNFDLIKAYREMAAEGGPFFDGYFNDTYADFVRDDFVYKPQTYLVHLPILYASVAVMLDEVKPSIVVHTSDVHPTGYILAQLARKRGIPTVNVQNGITGGVKYGYLPLLSDVTCSWGEYSREWMIEGGADPESIKNAGSPLALRFENLLDMTDRGETIRKLGLSGTTILVATNDFDRVQNRYMLLAALDVARSRPDWTFLFRPHPSETGEVQEGLLDAFELNNTRLYTGDLAELCPVLDGAIIGHSGIGVDLILAGVPIVYANFMSVHDYLPYAEKGAAIPARSREDVGPALDEAVAAGSEVFTEGHTEFKRAYLGDYKNVYRNIANVVREIYERG